MHKQVKNILSNVNRKTTKYDITIPSGCSNPAGNTKR